MFKKILVAIATALLLISSVLPSLSYKVYADSIHENITFQQGEDNVDFSNNYITGYLDNTGNIQLYTHVGQDRSATLMTIAVYVGKIIVGYIAASVVDGIVIAATGKSGGEWVATAIRSVVGRKYTGSVYLPISGPYTCPGTVIDHSGVCN